ncbi:MAG: metallophosphoesterase family protein [Candidatus Methanofastidiosia archaeon]|jgi:predicted phosphodiesterase
MKTVEKIYALLKEAPRTKEELAKLIGRTEKTVENNISILNQELKVPLQHIKQGKTILYQLSEGPLVKKLTERDRKLETPEYSFEEAKRLLIEYEKQSAETIGYNNVDIEIETTRPIMLIAIGDTHIGSRKVYYDRLFKDIEYISSNPYVFTMMTGDYADNYNTSAYLGGQIEQAIPIQDQKAYVVSIVKKISESTLGIVQGCHDEWSFFNDGFEFAQYLADHSQGYYMGHNGIINLKVGEVTYKIYVTHNTRRNSILNPGHGLACVFKDVTDADIAIGGHIHVPHFEQRGIRERTRTIMINGSYKGQDRFVSKRGFPPLVGVTPGMILFPDRKLVLGQIDYRNLDQFM